MSDSHRMEKQKWYVKLFWILLLIVFSPLIIIGLLIAGAVTLFRIPAAGKAYLKSQYYKDFHRKFNLGIVSSPEYLFYNSAMHRGLPIRFVRQEKNDLEYFIYQDTVFLFPNFDTMCLNDAGTAWEVNDDGDYVSFAEQYKLLLAGLETTEDLPIKVLVDRCRISEPDLNNLRLPDNVFVTWGYEEAFENEVSPLKMILPQNNSQLYDMMLKTPDLCGKIEFDESFIHWQLNEDITLNIGVDPQDCYIGVEKKVGILKKNITHWHPDISDIYKDICKIGKKGNVLVIRSFLGGATVLYYGSEELCPYPKEKKMFLGKYYYIVAEPIGSVRKGQSESIGIDT